MGGATKAIPNRSRSARQKRGRRFWKRPLRQPDEVTLTSIGGIILIRTGEARVIARELPARYHRARAVTLIGRTLLRVRLLGRSDEVPSWALVHEHYRGGDVCPAVDERPDEIAATQAIAPVPAEWVLHG
jgi:hypothetical protein